MATQTLAAHISLLFHPNPKDVMILGLASGVTAGEASYYDLDRLDILEISEQVVRASNYFTDWNSEVLSKPATHGSFRMVGRTLNCPIKNMMLSYLSPPIPGWLV